MGGTVTSNPNKDRQPVFYNGKAYMPETKGNFSYIEVGNHIIPVDLNDPSWFNEQVHGDNYKIQAYKRANAQLEEEKTECNKWLKYFQNLITQGKQDWTTAKKETDVAADEAYTASSMLRKIKAKREALFASSNVKKSSELEGYKRNEAEDYNEQIAQYTDDKKEYTSEMYQHIRERLRADSDVQNGCRGAQREISNIGWRTQQQIVNEHFASLA